MPDLRATLRDYDEGVLMALSQIWRVEIKNLSAEEQLEALYQTMLDTGNNERVWDQLDESARRALQLLVSSSNKMQVRQFEHLYGQIRQMGRGKIEKEQPHQQPQNTAEMLYYRGFINKGFEQAPSGMRPIVYVPDDLAEVLPLHKTQYENLSDEILDLPEMVIDISPLEEADVFDVRPADTSIVDDMTTLLAYLRIGGAGMAGHHLHPLDIAYLQPFLLNDGENRLAFLLGLGLSMGFIITQEGRAALARDNSSLPKWLGLPRWKQVRTLAEAWQTSPLYRDLWQVEGLHPDPEAGFPYDPTIGRAALIEFLRQFAPHAQWWSLDEFIEIVKASEPDFQRPGGDYSSWYIRNDEGEYLHGFESWEAIEGALIEFYLSGPMHWLGLVDAAEDAARLTAYGRAFIEVTAWPEPPDPPASVLVHDDGVLEVSRRVSRLDRFQLARFTTWMAAPIDPSQPYQYGLDAEGIEQGARQGITTEHIAAFLQRQLNGPPLPRAIEQLLQTWQAGAAGRVTFEPLLVLRTSASETLDRIYETPGLRQYLGARLGPMACVILTGREADLRAALGEAGMDVEILGAE